MPTSSVTMRRTTSRRLAITGVRSSFLAIVAATSPYEEYDQLDLHADYDIPGSNINIFFDNCLTEEGKRVHGRDSSWVQFVAPGMPVIVGARYTF